MEQMNRADASAALSKAGAIENRLTRIVPCEAGGYDVTCSWTNGVSSFVMVDRKATREDAVKCANEYWRRVDAGEVESQL